MSALASPSLALVAPTDGHGAALAVGLGCDRGTPLSTVQQCLQQALALAGGTLADVVVLASIEAKADEAAFLQLAEQHGWPLQWYSATQLAAVPVPNPSATVQRYMGTPSVSEAASLLAAQADLHALVVEKHKFRGPDGKNATVSIARMVCHTPCASPGQTTAGPTPVRAELVEALRGASTGSA